MFKPFDKIKDNVDKLKKAITFIIISQIVTMLLLLVLTVITIINLF